MKKIILWMAMIPLLGHSNQEMFDPFSKQAVLDLRSLNQEGNFKYHLKVIEKYKDLTLAQRVVEYRPEGDEKRKIFQGIRPTIQFQTSHYTKCNHVKYAKKTGDYLNKRYGVLREKGMILLRKLVKAQGRSLDYYEKKYSPVLEEIVEVLDLLEDTFPPEFYEPDRVATYNLKTSLQFKEILEEKQFRPAGNIKVEKIRLSSEWIPFSGELKEYLNFSSNAYVLGTEVIVKRDFIPLEACLGDHEISFIGETASERIPEPKPFTPIPGFGRHPWPVPIIPRPIFTPAPIGPWPRDPGWVDPLPPIIRGGNLR